MCHGCHMAEGANEVRSRVVGGFDETYYFKHGVGIAERAREQFDGSALLDYFWIGCRERRSPGDGFDEDYYLRSNPDVAAALRASRFLCGYHHYLKRGRNEGRRGVAPAQCCVVDARHSARPAEAVVALVSALQRARPRWRVLGLATWTPAAEAGLDRAAGWLEAPTDPDPARPDPGRDLLAAERPAYIVCLDGLIAAPLEDAVIVAAVEADAGRTEQPDAVDVVATIRSSELWDAAGRAILAERLASALEAAGQVKARARRGRLDAAIGLGAAIPVGPADGERVLTVVIELPAEASVQREFLVLQADGEPVSLEPSAGVPAQVEIHLAAGCSRVSIRPRKPRYRAQSRIALARIEAMPVDLVPPPDAAAATDLALIGLNADLARAKRALGRFFTNADALTAARPAIEFRVPPIPRLAPVVIPRCLVVSGFDTDRSWVGRDVFDVAGWRDYLDARGFDVDLLELPVETAGDVARLRERDLVDHRFVVLTGPRAPGLLTEGRASAGHLVRLYRGAASGGRGVETRLRAADLACARAADRLIVCDAADAAGYRAAGVPDGRIDHVPLFLPPAFRVPVRPYAGRPRRLLVLIDTPALLDGRVRRSGLGADVLARLGRSGWRLTIGAAPRLRARIADEFGLDGLQPQPDWSDPSTDLPVVLQSTRLAFVPGLEIAEIGGLVAAARIIGFRVLLDGPERRRSPADGHLVSVPGAAVPERLDALDRNPGCLDPDTVRAEAFRSLDRIFGFRSAGWQEGRGDRPAGI